VSILEHCDENQHWRHLLREIQLLFTAPAVNLYCLLRFWKKIMILMMSW